MCFVQKLQKVVHCPTCQERDGNRCLGHGSLGHGTLGHGSGRVMGRVTGQSEICAAVK